MAIAIKILNILVFDFGFSIVAIPLANPSEVSRVLFLTFTLLPPLGT